MEKKKLRIFHEDLTIEKDIENMRFQQYWYINNPNESFKYFIYNSVI